MNGAPIFSEQCLPTLLIFVDSRMWGDLVDSTLFDFFPQLPPIEAKVVCSFEINRYS